VAATAGLRHGAARTRRETSSFPSPLLGVASFQVIRLVPFFSLSVLVLFGPLLAGRSASARAHIDARGWAGALIIWTICVASSTIGQARVGCLQTRGAFFVDEQAASFLRENQATGRLVVWFDWGEYVSWHFGPEIKVSMDGRRETVYSAALLQAHDEFYRNGSGAREFLERLSPDYVWLPKTVPVSPMITGWGWTPIRDRNRPSGRGTPAHGARHAPRPLPAPARDRLQTDVVQAFRPPAADLKVTHTCGENERPRRRARRIIASVARSSGDAGEIRHLDGWSGRGPGDQHVRR
jgi:hypothetical protein